MIFTDFIFSLFPAVFGKLALIVYEPPFLLPEIG